MLTRKQPALWCFHSNPSPGVTMVRISSASAGADEIGDFNISSRGPIYIFILIMSLINYRWKPFKNWCFILKNTQLAVNIVLTTRFILPDNFIKSRLESLFSSQRVGFMKPYFVSNFFGTLIICDFQFEHFTEYVSKIGIFP